jgi:hypothetical protein
LSRLVCDGLLTWEPLDWDRLRVPVARLNIPLPINRKSTTRLTPLMTALTACACEIQAGVCAELRLLVTFNIVAVLYQVAMFAVSPSRLKKASRLGVQTKLPRKRTWSPLRCECLQFFYSLWFCLKICVFVVGIVPNRAGNRRNLS